MKKRGKIILGILAALIVVAGGAFYTWAQQPSSRLLLSSIYFMEVTLKNPGYLLHDIDIMEMCRDYGNGDTELTGKVGLSGMQQVKSSIYFDVDAKRSFAQKLHFFQDGYGSFVGRYGRVGFLCRGSDGLHGSPAFGG